MFVLYLQHTEYHSPNFISNVKTFWRREDSQSTQLQRVLKLFEGTDLVFYFRGRFGLRLVGLVGLA